MSSPSNDNLPAAPAREALTFRARFRVEEVISPLWMAAMAVVSFTLLLPFGMRALLVMNSFLLAFAGICVAVAVWRLVPALRGSLTVDADGLRIRSGLGSRTALWREVTSVSTTAAGGPVSLVLRFGVSPPSRFLSGVVTDRSCLILDLSRWEEPERLVSEVVARVPSGTASADVLKPLAAAPRVPWRHRLMPLIGLAFLAGVVAYWLVAGQPFAHDIPDFIMPMGLLWVFMLPLGMIGRARALDRECRWKSFLGGLGWPLLLPTCFASLLEVFVSAGGALPLIMATMLGWAGVTFVLYLPIRARGWQAAASYLAVLVPLLGAAWWFKVRSPIPCRSTAALRIASFPMVWSPDGSILCGAGSPPGKEGVLSVVDAKTLAETRSLTLPSASFSFYVADAHQVLYRNIRGPKGRECELWAVDLASGETHLVHAAGELRLAEQGFLSPDGSEVVFVAGQGEERDVYLARRTDLSVRKVAVPFLPRHFDSARWRGDGTLIVTQSNPAAKKQREWAVWSLPAGGGQPVCLYRKTAVDVAALFSPNVRWALVGSGPEFHKMDHADLVDLATGASRALLWPIPSPILTTTRWSPDGDDLAYAADEEGRQGLFILHAPSGGVVRLDPPRGFRVSAVFPSRGARYLACESSGTMRMELLVLDGATGRLTGLRRACPRGFSMYPAWSPVRETLALVQPVRLFDPDPSCRLFLYNFEPR